MTSLSVPHPEITEVLDLRSGRHLSVREVIGSSNEEVIPLRLAIKTGQKEGVPLYACSMCNVAVSLLMHPESRLFFFRHLVEDGRCSAVTRGQLSRQEIDARKYNGTKESARHIRMKELVAESLRADPRFSTIQVEERWTGALTGQWRKPDVSAILEGQNGNGPTKVAFEIQLSTTYLDVIAERRLFYLKEGGLLFWIFAEFNDDDRRLTQDDVFYNNNQNAFIVNEETTDASILTGELHMDCLWAEPRPGGAISSLQRALVSFHKLTLDKRKQQAFYFDFDGARATLQAEKLARYAPLRERFEEFWLNRDHDTLENLRAWRLMRADFRKVGIDLSDYPNHLPTHLVYALYSAKHGRNIGWDFPTFIQLAHWMVAAYKPHLEIFRIALRVYDRANQLRVEDKTGKWRKKVAGYKEAIAAGDPQFKADTTHDRLIAFLFPELFDDEGRRLPLA